MKQDELRAIVLGECYRVGGAASDSVPKSVA